MSSNKKKLILNTVSVDIGCGGRCKKPKLSKIFNPKPIRTKTHCYDLYRSSSTTSSNTNPFTATTFSPTMETPVLKSCYGVDMYKNSSRTVRGFGRVGGESVAVEKDSDDPYLDFRHSMLQMILEKQIYSKDDLRELLNCFLQLNSPSYHGIIVKAFTEIWNGVFSVQSSGGGDGWEKQHQWRQQQQQQHHHYHHHSYHHVQHQEQDYYGYGFHMSRDF